MQESAQSPYRRYKPHLLIRGILPASAAPGRYHVAEDSAVFEFFKTLCHTGGSWLPKPTPVAGYRLVDVELILNDAKAYDAYEYKQKQMLLQRKNGGEYFNFATATLKDKQLQVLSCLREQFQERTPGMDPVAVNTFYSFHGPRRENLDSICQTGLVATRAMDAGDFGSGCYSTLNIEYAIQYAHGIYDAVPRRQLDDKRYPVVMFAASVGVAYPVTPELDYPPHGGQSNFYGRPLQPGFDCHVACVSVTTRFQAVNRPECQYVEVVIDQQVQMLPLAVLWFEAL
jgi:hypothetical protein